MSKSGKLCAVIIGASGGIGAAVTQILAHSGHYEAVHALSRTEIAPKHPSVLPGHIDISDEDSIAAAARHVPQPPDLIFVATGLLSHQRSPEKSWRHLDATTLLALYQTNTVGPALVAKHFLPLLPRDRRAVFAALSARVGSIADNRLGGWHSYRASKAALNQLIRCWAIELRRTHPQALCIGVHPGTVDTALSKPYQRGVKPEKLFTAEQAAAQILHSIDALSTEDSGSLFAYDRTAIPF